MYIKCVFAYVFISIINLFVYVIILYSIKMVKSYCILVTFHFIFSFIC